MNTARTTNRIAAAVKAGQDAAKERGIELMRPFWANCKSVKVAISTDRAVTLEASPSGHWALRHKTEGCIASGQA